MGGMVLDSNGFLGGFHYQDWLLGQMGCGQSHASCFPLFPVFMLS